MRARGVKLDEDAGPTDDLQDFAIGSEGDAGVTDSAVAELMYAGRIELDEDAG